MSDAVVHVFDPGEPGKTRDFTCSIHTLTHGMRYFKDVLQKSVDSRVTPVEISVHCDVAVFEWLLGYCSGRVTHESITVEGLLPLLIASNFLQMDTLVGDCLTFMANNLVAVAKHHLELAAQGSDLTALPLELLSRLARLVPERKLEELALLTSAEGRARHMPLANRLYKYKLEGCLRELRTTVARCSICQGLFSLAERAKLECTGPPLPPPLSKPSPSQTQRRSGTAGVHIPDAAWRLQEYLSSLRAQQIPWRGIYWHIWGLVHVLYCHTCMHYVPAAELRRCVFHPQAPVFAATAATGGGGSGTARHLATGFYPCCGAAAMRGADPRITNASGCCSREHRLVPSGQAPGAPLPTGLTPELLSTLQHCMPLFTYPSALLVREPSYDSGLPRPGVSSGVTAHCAAVGDPRPASPAAVNVTAAAVVAPDGTAAAKSPLVRHVSFLGGKSANAPRTGLEDVLAADADGRLVPPAIQTMLGSSAAEAQRRSGSSTFGPAMAATAAALGYTLNGVPGLDLGVSGPGPPQLLLPVPSSVRPQSPQSQTSLSLATALANSPLQITGNLKVDTQRVAAAVARRLSRASSGGSGGSGSGGGADGEPTAPVPQQRHQQHRQLQLDHGKQARMEDQGQPKPQQARKRHQQEQPQQSRRATLPDTVRSFTSLAALQQVAEEGATTTVVQPPTAPSRTTSRLVTQPGKDWERAIDPDQQPSLQTAAGAASLRLLLKSAMFQSSGSGITQAVVQDRSPRPHRKNPLRSPNHPNNTHQPISTSATSSVNLDPLMIQLAAPLSSPSTMTNTTGRASPELREASPPCGIAAIAERRRPLHASGLLPGDKLQHHQLQAPLQSYSRQHQNQRLQHAQQQTGAMPSQGNRDRAIHRGLSDRNGVGAKRDATLPPRPAGLAPGGQRRHSGSSYPRSEHVGGPGTDSGDGGGGEEDDDHLPARRVHRGNSGTDLGRPRPPGGGSDLSRVAQGGEGGDGMGSTSGTPSAGSSGGRGGCDREPNPLQRSVQIVLLQQRQRRQEVQEQQQQQPNPPQQPQAPSQYQQQQQHPHHLPSHHHQSQQVQTLRQRSAGKVRQGNCSWGSGEDAAAAAEEQERRALIEQYKTQKVLSPRPKNVHMISISELPSVSAGGGAVASSASVGERPAGAVTPRGPSGHDVAASVEYAESPGVRPFRESVVGIGQDAFTARSLGEVVPLTEASPNSAAFFALAREESDAPVVMPPPPALSPPAAIAVAIASPPIANPVGNPPPTRARKLRMELLYEDDNYRMDLLEKHLLACRPSNRIGNIGAGARDQKSFRARFALPPSSRAAGGIPTAGTGRGRPLSAAAATYGSRQARPRSRSVSHLQRLQGIYMSSPATTFMQTGGSTYGSRFSGATSATADVLAGKGDGVAEDFNVRSSYVTVDPRYSVADWEKMGLGEWNATAGGSFRAAARDARPLSAPRTWRYT